YGGTSAGAVASGTLRSVAIHALGHQDGAGLSAATRDLTETGLAAHSSSPGTRPITDGDSPATFVAQAATVGLYGTFAIDAAGACDRTSSAEENGFAAGIPHSDTFPASSAHATLGSVSTDSIRTNDPAMLSHHTRNRTRTT